MASTQPCPLPVSMRGTHSKKQLGLHACMHPTACTASGHRVLNQALVSSYDSDFIYSPLKRLHNQINYLNLVCNSCSHTPAQISEYADVYVHDYARASAFVCVCASAPVHVRLCALAFAVLCAFARVCVCMLHLYMYGYAYVYMYTHTSVHTSIHVHVCIYIERDICVYACTYMCTHACLLILHFFPGVESSAGNGTAWTDGSFCWGRAL